MAAGLLAVHVLLLLYGSWVHSPNELEANLLPAGYVHLRHGRFDIAQVNPPLSRMVCAIPLLLMDIDDPWDEFAPRADLRAEYNFGRLFLRRNAHTVRWVFFAARCASALFSLVGGIAVGLIAKRLFGGPAALASLVMWCFSPMILGHGATANHDVPGAAMTVLAFWFFLDLLDSADWYSAILFGIFSGLALLTRTTSALLIGSWLFYFLIGYPHSSGQKGIFTRLQQTMAVLVLSLVILNLGYAGNGTFCRLGDYDFFSKALGGPKDGHLTGNRYRGTLLENLPIPLPRDYVVGLDLQQRDFESPPFESYLAGTWRDHGWWYYYLLAWCFKTPIGFQLLLFSALAIHTFRALRGHPCSRECVIFGNVAIVFVITAVKSGFTTHYRYILPAFPFMILLCGSLFTERQRAAGNIPCLFFLLAGAISSLAQFPDSLAYFNAWTGGPSHGSQYLLHSSCDWGQDLYKLAAWVRDQNNIDRSVIRIEISGPLERNTLELPDKRIPRRKDPDGRLNSNERLVSPGKYAISINILRARHSPYRYLEKLDPANFIGHTILVYNVTQEDVQRHKWNLPPCK